MESLKELQHFYHHRHDAAMKWKGEGRSVIGYTCETTPEELLYAAGCLPVRMVGDPNRDIVDAYRYYDNYCTPVIAGVLEAYLKGDYDYLDGCFMARSNDALTMLYYNLQGYTEIKPKNLFWLDVPRGVKRRHFAWLTAELGRVRGELERAFGVTVSDASLEKAIGVHNRNRSLLRHVNELRQRTPSVLTGKEVHEIIGAGLWMPKEQHSQLLERLLQDAGSKPIDRAKKVRLWLSGSPQHNLDLVTLIEGSGATVVGDDLTTGGRYICGDVSADALLDPVEAIAENIIYNRPSPRFFGTTAWADYFERNVTESKPDGVIFYYIQWEDDLAWHYPDLKARLDKTGIPSLLLTQQEYRLAAPERLRLRIETFIQSLAR